MIESLMYAAIGFLTAVLLGLAVIPLVHNRAIRLTMRQLEGGLPRSMAELQAEKDALRAEFAMAIRRLEITNEQLRTRLARQMVRLSQKDDLIKQMRSHILAESDPRPIMPSAKAPRKSEPRRQQAA